MPRPPRRPLVALLAALAMPAAAQAEPTGHYDPQAIPPTSRAFVEASKASADNVTPIERALVRTDGALAALELSLALGKPTVEGTQHDLWKAKLDARSTAFFAEAEAFQTEVYRVGDAFQVAFEGALKRALAGLEGEVVDCAEPPASALEAIGGAMAKPRKSTCPGPDLSERIAKAWDDDEELAAEIKPLRAPLKLTVTAYDAEEPVLAMGGGPSGTTWVSPAELATMLPMSLEILDAVDARADEAREVLKEAKASLQPDDPLTPDMLLAIRGRAIALREWTEARRADVGSALWAAIDRNRKKGKRAGWSDVGVCLNPVVWGGCEGRDKTEDVTEHLLDDKKLNKALLGLLEAMPAPVTDLTSTTR